jgi:hypothetical protein
MRRAVLVLIALLATAAPAAAQPVAHTAAAFPYTNGRDAAAWVDASGLRVSYDDGRRLTHPAPDYPCQLGALSSTEAGFLCTSNGPASVKLVNLAGGDVRQPASEPLIESLTPDSGALSVGYSIGALGQDLVKIVSFEDHVGENDAWFRLDTEQELDLYHPPTGSVVDLDVPSGVRRVCAPAPMVRTPVPDYVWPWIMTVHDGRVALRHCGSRLTRLVGRIPKGMPGVAVLTRRYAAWPSDDEHVAIRMLATGRTHRVRVPSIEGLAGTEHRLFVKPSGYTRDHPQVIAIP